MKQKEKIYYGFCAAAIVVLAGVSAAKIRALLRPAPVASQIKALPELTGKDIIGDARNSLGKADAPDTLVEFADYECPFCKPTHDALKTWTAAHPEVRFVFRHYPLMSKHPDALIAAVAAEAAGEQGKFWPMHDLLYAHSDHLARRDLDRYALALGLDAARFHKAFSRRSATVARVSADLKDAERLKLDGTPSLLWRRGNGQVSSLAASDLDRITR